MLLGLRAVPACGLERGPYLVDASSVYVTACWRDRQVDECRTFADLAPGATFAYSLPGYAQSWLARTLPATLPLRVAALGDSGAGGRHQRRVARALERFDPDLVLHLGDIVYPTGADEDYDGKYFKSYENILSRVAFFPTLGNHDYANDGDADDGERRYRQAYSKIHRRPKYYSFEAAGVHFISLDSNEAYGIGAAAPIGPESQQRRWLEESLRRSQAEWKIVFLHVPVYSGYSHGDHEFLRASLEPLFVKYGVDVVFQGHNHIYERSRSISGVVYVTAGNGGRSLRRVRRTRQPWLEKRLGEYGFAAATIERDSLTLEMIDEKGRALDRVVLKKP